MGVPRMYYVRSLQNFAHCLAITVDENWRLAKEMYETEDEPTLEAFILERKAKLPNNDYYYLAGRAAQVVIDEAADEGSDGLTACCGGISGFNDWLGVEQDEEEQG